MWPSLLLPAGSLGSARSLRLATGTWLPAPLGMGCQRGAWRAGAGLGGLTVAASVVAGLLGPAAIAVYAVALSRPVWVAWWWLVRRG